MVDCTENKPCIPCYCDQGVCQAKKNEFLRELTELSYKYDLILDVNASSGLMFISERNKDYLHCEGYREVISGCGEIEWCDA